MINVEDFTEEYQKLIIRQYYDKPKAKAEVGVKAESWAAIAAFVDEYAEAFDLDMATGDRLDKIGKIVGAPRVVPFVVPKIKFGFDGNPNARGFADPFDSSRQSAPFLDAFEPTRTPFELDDDNYRFFIKLKVAVNNTSAFLFSDDHISINDVINQAFDGEAYVVDNKDMSLTLYISPAVDETRLQIVIQLGLLPRPQGVKYGEIVQAEIGNTFGFSNNPNSKGFADPFEPTREGGAFAVALPI